VDQDNIPSPAEGLTPKDLRASFGITENNSVFEEKPDDGEDAKELLESVLKGGDLSDEDTKLNPEKKERNENTLGRDRFVEAVRLVMYSKKENEDKPTDLGPAKIEKKRRRDGKPVAIDLLRNNGVDVDYLMGSTEVDGASAQEKSKNGIERRKKVKMVNAAISKKELIYTEEVDDILLRMNVDDNKLSEWGVVAGTINEVELNPARPADGEVGVDGGGPEENGREPRKNIEKYIRENEKRCLDHFAKFFDENAYNPGRFPNNLENIRFLREFLDNIPGLQRDFGNNYEDMFRFAQDVYFGQLMPKSYAGMSAESNTILQREVKNDEVDEQGRDRLRARIVTAVEMVAVSRKWAFTDEMVEGSTVLLGFLEKRFNTSEIKNDKDGLELAFKYFKDSYMGLGEVPPNEIKMDNMKLNESQRETVSSILTVRNLARDLDKATSFENLGKKYTAADSAIKNIMNMDLPNCDKPVARIMEWYIGQMGSEWKKNQSVGVDIDTPAIRAFIEGKWSGTFPNDKELKMLMEMARDVIRVTGMDSQFFTPYDGVSDPIKPERGGSFLSGAINFERKIKTKYSSLHGLVDSVNFGLVPFMRKIEGEKDENKWRGLRYSDIVNLTNNKFQGLAYTSWLNSFEGVVGAQKAEEEFLKAPSVDAFVNNLVKVYGYKKEDAKPYLRNRFKALIEYLLTDKKRNTPKTIKDKLEQVFIKDNLWDDKGIYSSMYEMADDMSIYGVRPRVENVTKKNEDNISYNKGFDSRSTALFRRFTGIDRFVEWRNRKRREKNN